MQLLERHTQLAELEAARQDAIHGRGSVVLVAGEAGSGKTALVQQFGTSSAHSTHVLQGLCDDLLLPRPLAPFRDMFPQFGRELAVAADQVGDPGWVNGFFDRLVGELIAPAGPGIVIVEDAQWADEATLDAIRFLGRRISRLRSMLVVTYRDGEVPADHPLRLTIGAMPAADIRRIRLERLSREAVAQLAGSGDIDALYDLTGGNPFYVREMLENPDSEKVPATVQDAVLARVRRLNPAVYAGVEVVAVMPGRAERWVLDRCSLTEQLDEAVRLGVLRADGGEVFFPHELSRRAVELSLSPSRRRELNAQVLNVLASQDADPARLVHHAHEAGDGAALARYAPTAAARAARLNSHREAIAHLEHAIANGRHLVVEQLADLLDAYGRECEMARVHAKARDALQQSVRLRERLGDRAGLGRSLSRLASLEWGLGDGAAARRSAARSVEVLRALPPGSDLVVAYGQVARLAMIDYRADETLEWGQRAIALARRIGEPDAAIHAEVTVGVAHLLRDPEHAAPLDEALRHAVERDDSYAASRAYVNLAEGHAREMRYDAAARYLAEGLAYCEQRDLQALGEFLISIRSWCHLELGQWSLAGRDAQLAARASEVAARLPALRTTALIQARRGDPAAASSLLAVEELTAGLGEAPATIHLGTLRAELAWLGGDQDAVRRAMTGMPERAREVGTPRYLGETAYWMFRAGRVGEAPAGAPEPYALQLAGRWQEAARVWDQLGRPYEHADALSDSPEPGAQLAALEIFDRLGAVPRAAMVRTTLSRRGVTSVPRGPRRATRSSPAGLTPRQTEVLALLAEDLTYQQIAQRLQVSPKTVDHHVTAVRVKLGVSSRDQAVHAGLRLGILTSEDGEKSDRS